MMESAIMDVAPDEAMEMNKKKRMLRWDAKKRKFVKVGRKIHVYVCIHTYVYTFVFTLEGSCVYASMITTTFVPKLISMIL
jgi:hypothetical protein